ncbi:penicillin acylase family protein [Niveibacterium sp. SC-1]|uniref:penicillin acylase family protein n=1 Tax=Niveibacterium sp. SC-1 TaxID=3135646 RepID=UPI00311FBC64
MSFASTPRWPHATVVFLSSVALLAGCGGGDHKDAHHYRADVRRTSYGIVHVRADDEAGLGYGVGHAYAEDNLCLMADQVLTLSGERSRYFGETATVETPLGPVDNRSMDRYMKLLGDDTSVRAAWTAYSPDIQTLLSGYVAGFNRVLRDQGSAQWPKACRGAAWVRPIAKEDLVRLMRFYATLDGLLPLLPLIVDANPATATATGGGPVASLRTLGSRLATASNALALGSEATDTGGGMLLGQPHFGWRGILRMYQVHLTVPGRMDVMGASLPGMPVVAIGFNDRFAWSHTTSAIAHATVYRLKLDPNDPTRYEVDGQYRPMQRRIIERSVRGADGKVRTVSETFYLTDFGWLAIEKGQAFAVRDPNLDNHRMLDHWLALDRAQDLEAVKAAVRRVQGDPWNNLVAADREGRTLFMGASVVPRLTAEQLTACALSPNTQTGAPLLDGTTTTCAWQNDPAAPQPGIFAAADIPALERRDFVHNSNNSAWLTNPAAPLLAASPVISQDGEVPDLRTRLGLLQVIQRLDGSDGEAGRRMSIEQVKAFALNNRVHLADLVLDDLLAACDGPWKRDTDADLREGCGALHAWNRKADLDAGVGLGYLDAWWFLVRSTRPGDAAWRVPYDPADPLHTPRGLATDDALVATQLRDALVLAVQRVRAAGWTPDKRLGDVQMTRIAGRSIPIHGANDELGVYNAQALPVAPDELPMPHEVFWGTSYLQAVSLRPDAIQAFGLLAYSQSSDPDSPHAADQTERFSRKQWIALPFTEAQILADPSVEHRRLAE